MKTNQYTLLVTCLIWVSVIPLPVLALIVCPDHEAPTEEKLEKLLLDHTFAGVIRLIEFDVDSASSRYILYPPPLKGSAEVTGNVSFDYCNTIHFDGDVLLLFGKVEANTLVAERTLRLYSQQWDLLWSDPALSWLLKRHALVQGQ